MFWPRLRSYFAPCPASLTLVWAAGFEFVAFTWLLSVYGLTEANLMDSLLLMSVSGTPLAGVLLVGAALRERRNGPRFFLWAGVVLLVVASLSGFVVSMAATSPSSRPGLFVLLACCGAGLLIPLGFMAWSGFRIIPELKAILRAARYQRILTMIDARGETSLAEIGREISLELVRVEALLDELIASGELMAFLFRDSGCVYSLSALAEKQRLLIGIVQAQGKARLAELAGSLRVPPDLVLTWVYHLAQRGLFHGALDSEQGIVYSCDAAHLGQTDGRCPHCGGQLDLAGKGVIQCLHCGVEVFL